MKRTFEFTILFVLLMLLTGCTGRNNNEMKIAALTSAELATYNLEDTSSNRTRNIDDICTHAEPLVMQEVIYDESDEIVQINKFEYDEQNRYDIVYSFQKNTEDGELELFIQEKYSYDEFSYSIETTYFTKNGLVTRNVYDLHNQLIIEEIPDKGYEHAITNSFTHSYVKDTAQVEEDYCYRGEGHEDYYHSLKRYNQNGDEIYYMVQYDPLEIHTRNMEYYYDDGGRIGVKVTVDGSSMDEYTNIENKSFTYNSDGQVTREYTTGILNKGSDYEISFVEDINNTYDEEGRLISKKTDYSNNRGMDTSTLIVYEYDERNVEEITQ